MNKLKYFLLFLFLFNFFSNPNNNAYALSETNTYAKALPECVLYKTSSLEYSIDNIYFIVPESYFVIVLDIVSETCCKVQYDKFIGYVKSDTLVFSTFIPVVKFLNGITCEVEEFSGTQVWNKPSASGDVLSVISAGTKNVKYIANVYGIIPAGGESNLWYYVSYTPPYNSTNVYEGYVYSENISSVSNIPYNNETNPELIEGSSIGDEIIYISSSMKTILTVLIAVPIILLILIILYKIAKKFKNNTNKRNFCNNKVSDKLMAENEIFDNQKNLMLKNKINQMKGLSFIKKIKPTSQSLNIPYPNFVSYDSDEDLL